MRKALLLIFAWGIALLLSGCASMQDKSTKNDSDNLRVSGDLTVSAVDRKGF